MTEIRDPEFRAAVEAIDAGDVAALRRLMNEYPRVVGERLNEGEGYFARPYLLWFVAENPVRRGMLPANIVEVARAILEAARRHGAGSYREQVDGTLGLVCSGRVPRERGVQNALIDLLIDAGARGDGALVSALAHRETGAADRLLARGTPLTLLAAVCLGRGQDAERLAEAAGSAERQLALAGAALFGRPWALALLVRLGVDLNAYSPQGFHPHATALHHAVDSGSLDAVKVLVEAGADLRARDHVHDGTPLGWAEHEGHEEIAVYLRERQTLENGEAR